MKRKKICGLLLTLTLSLSMLASCGGTAVSTGTSSSSDSAVAASEESTADQTTGSNAKEAAQLMLDLTGTYQELWPVVLADEYRQLWLDDAAALVGEESAETAVEKLASMVTGEIIGEEAVKAYADGSGVYDCSFMQDVKTFEFFDGDKIRGFDASGSELFSHTYTYVGMEEIRGLYIYKTEDADAGEFTYFCMAPDTMETTWHIEFRYGSDLGALGEYDTGAYAYWLAAGISTDCTQEDISNTIQLFCDENLSAS